MIWAQISSSKILDSLSYHSHYFPTNLLIRKYFYLTQIRSLPICQPKLKESGTDSGLSLEQLKPRVYEVETGEEASRRIAKENNSREGSFLKKY
jgi:hypothetical protein